jgi:hypothetical protein
MESGWYPGSHLFDICGDGNWIFETFNSQSVKLLSVNDDFW